MLTALAVRIRRFAPWLVTLTAVTCLGVELRRDRRQNARIAELSETFARSQARARHAVRYNGPEFPRCAGIVQAQAVATSQAIAGDDPRDHLDGRRDDPGYALVWHRQQQRIIERQYGYAVAALNLGQSESTRLKELLTARREAIVDARDAAKQVGITGPQVNVAVEQSVDGFTEEIKQMVGTDAYYGRLEMAPTISTCKTLLENTVGVDLAARGDPLTNDQLYSLAQSYVDAAYSPGGVAQAQDPDSGTGLTPQYEAFLSRVSGRLSASQATAVRDFLVEQVQTQRVSGGSDREGGASN